ncbi:hypothetical protein POM88_003573 [Heracleum sosnowskyi]|uniref:Uncharacterized protein n=1 Tax=Heracleum sosnowskyi TaxID=360622 RepID=A0AAD8NDN8_9APIA|nr:hypothetical protein POM88_003573 [Heracleum sosnowskyi]
MFQSFSPEFVPNNYAAPLSNENAPEAFHLLQNFLAQSAIGHALVEPALISGLQVKAFWETGVYDDGGETGTPSIVFAFDEQEYVVTPGTVHAALGFGEFTAYTISVGDVDLQRMMTEIGYNGSMARIGQLKRPFLRKEWSFFFDCLTRAFGKKCTNWDAIPIDSLQIGYSLLYNTNYDFARLVLSNIGEKMTENRGVVYFARFCQLLFTACVPAVEIAANDVIPAYKLHKRILSDLINKDVKKGNVGELLLPAVLQHFLAPQPEPQSQQHQSEPQQPEPQSQQVNSDSQVAPKPKTGGRTKHRAFKAVSLKPDAALPHSVGTSRRKKRAHIPVSDAHEPSNESESANAKKRKLVAAYLFEDIVQNLVSDSTNTEAPEAANQEVITDEADVVIEEIVVDDNTTVPIVDRVNTDENPEVFLEPILEMDNEEEIEAVSVPDLANADKEAEVFEQEFNADFGEANVNEAHPSISVCDTEDVAADQPTQIIDESIATHTEILSVTNTIQEKGEEVDQVLEAAVDLVNEPITEDIVKLVPEETEALATANSEHIEVVEKSVPIEAEVFVNSEIPEAAQPNAEATAEIVAEETEAANSEHSFHANSNINAEVSHSDESIPFLRDPTAEQVKENIAATEAHYRDMYYANWSGADCIFSNQRTADFVAQSAKEISNPELLSHFKATIVQVKSLHNRFDETHKAVIGLSNDFAAKELAVRNERSRLTSIIKDQVDIKQRLSKGERVPKDKCKRTQTLRQRDDGTDGGSKETEKRSKSSQEQGRLRSNSARQTNSERLNSGGQSSSRLKSLVISSNPTTDEEIAAKLFMKEHGGEATMEDMDIEMKLLAEEHQKNIEAGIYKKKAKAPRKKEMGISIKENVNSQQSLQYTRRPMIAKSDKGKGKLIEEGQLPKKNYSTSDVAQVESRINKSTTDVAHVDVSTKTQTTSNIAQVVKKSEAVTTSDTTQVVQTQLSSQLQRTFGKSVIVQHSLIPANTNLLQSRTVMGKESRDKSGLGSHREKRVNNSPMDHTSLAEPGVGVTQENLDTLESVQLIYHRGLKKDFLLYFKSDGRVYRVSEDDIGLKMKEELEYVLYLLKVKNQRTHQAAEVLRSRMMKARILSGLKSAGSYIPRYRDDNGKLVEMQRNRNDMRKNNIYSLRAAIYQTGESDPELKELKEIMVDELDKAERRLLIDYLRTVPDIEEIK